MALRQQDDSQPRKAYTVIHTALAYKTLMVYGHTAKDALERARRGEGQGIDVDYEAKGYRDVRRSPDDDR